MCIVQARDVVKSLNTIEVSNIRDFNWISQLRYYNKDSKTTVSMITTTLDYGNEYLGNTPRLVITPLTDRCYRYTLVICLSVQSCYIVFDYNC